MQRAPDVRQLHLEVLDSVQCIGQFGIGELGDGRDDRSPHHGVENGAERIHHMVGWLELRIDTARDRRPDPLAHQVGKACDQFAEIATPALGTAPRLLGEEIEPTLGQPTDIGRAVLELCTLGAHRPDPLDWRLSDADHIGGIDNSFQLGNHPLSLPGTGSAAGNRRQHSDLVTVDHSV